MTSSVPTTRAAHLVDEALQQLDAPRGILIGGTWQSGENGAFDLLDPATAQVLTPVADGSVAQATAAVDAAEAAAQGWADAAPRTRSEALMRVFEAMRADTDRLAALISAENGKALTDARAEVAYAAEFFRWFAEECVRTGGRYGDAPAGGTKLVVTHRPVGIAALVTPWNFPAAMGARKIAPALAAGCTVVIKPASETPLTTLAMVRIIEAAGVPAGVVNVVPTSTAGDVVGTWLKDSRVRKLSFTGSTGVGRTLLAQCAERVVNASMELGGNAPFVVCDDADLDLAVDAAMVAKFRGGGQACTAANRFLVHEAVAEEFTRRLGEKVAALHVGPALTPSETSADAPSEVGPMISAKAVRNVTAMVDEAVAAGARVVATAPVPAATPGHDGFFYAPTLLADVPRDARVVTEEIFGPVAPVVTWNDEADLIELVNATEMGLAAYVISSDLKRAMKIAERTQAGMIGINRGLVSDPAAPFGGMKQSGTGREGAREGLEAYQEIQYFSIDWS